MPESPREWDNITIMACWHSRYRLGDSIRDKEPEDFWRRLVRENMPESEVYAMAEAGLLNGIRIEKHEDDPELVDIYETVRWLTVIGKSEPKECLEHKGVNKDDAICYLLDDLTIDLSRIARQFIRRFQADGQTFERRMTHDAHKRLDADGSFTKAGVAVLAAAARVHAVIQMDSVQA